MQKFTSIICFILISISLISSSVSFENATDVYFTGLDTTNYDVTKQSTIDSDTFLNLLDKKAVENNVSFYSYVNIYNKDINSFVQTYFLSSNFKINSPYVKDSTLPIDNFKNKQLQVPATKIKYNITSIKEFSKYNPNYKQIKFSLIGSQANINNFVQEIAKIANITKSKGAASFSNDIRPFILITLVLILALLFDEKNKMKEYNILLLAGYSKLKILLFEFKNILKYLFFLSIIAIIFIFLTKGFEISLLPYFILFSFKYLILTLVIIIFLTLIIKFNFLKKKINYKFLQGFKSTRFEKILLYAVKVIAIVIMLSSLYYTINDIKQTESTIKLNQKYASEFKNYVSLPGNLSGKVITDELFKQLSTTDYELYKNSVDANDGIFIDSTLFSDQDTTREHQEQYLYTNSNYLQINPILASGKQLTETDITKNDIVVLYPDGFNPNTLDKEDFTNLTDIGYVKYDNNQEFETFNPKIKTKNNKVKDPIIIIENKLDATHKGNILNCYILKNNNISQLLKKYDPEGFIKHPQSVEEIFNGQIDTLKYQLHTSLRSLTLSIIIILLVITFLISNFITENKKEIFLQKIHGYSKRQIYNNLLVTNAAIYIFIASILVFLDKTELYKLLLIIMLTDYLFILLTIFKKERRSNADQIRKN